MCYEYPYDTTITPLDTANARIQALEAELAKAREQIRQKNMHLVEYDCELAAQRKLVRSRDEELLRVRTTGHGAAHELDNIAVECGLGHSPTAGVVAQHVRELREAMALFAEEAASYREKQAARRRDSDDRYRECVDRHRHAMAAVDANPIASAAVEEGRKDV